MLLHQCTISLRCIINRRYIMFRLIIIPATTVTIVTTTACGTTGKGKRCARNGVHKNIGNENSGAISNQFVAKPPWMAVLCIIEG